MLDAGRPPTPYPQVARELKMSEGAVRMAAQRLRQRYREVP